MLSCHDKYNDFINISRPFGTGKCHLFLLLCNIIGLSKKEHKDVAAKVYPHRRLSKTAVWSHILVLRKSMKNIGKMHLSF